MRLHHVRRGSGSPLLLVHGIGDSHRAWSRVLGRLARDHEVFAIDLPGFGRSPALPGEPTIQAQSRAVTDFMRAEGHDRFHVAGNSMGGAVALELARGDRVLSATALSPSGFTEGWEHLWVRGTLTLTRQAGRLLGPHAARLTRTPLARRLLAGEMVADGAHYTAEELAATLADVGACPSFEDALGPVNGHAVPAGIEFACPVTIAWGDRDYLLLYGPQARRARERLPGVRHVRLRRCGHIPMWDDAELVARTIVETTSLAATERSGLTP